MGWGPPKPLGVRRRRNLELETISGKSWVGFGSSEKEVPKQEGGVRVSKLETNQKSEAARRCQRRPAVGMARGRGIQSRREGWAREGVSRRADCEWTGAKAGDWTREKIESRLPRQQPEEKALGRRCECGSPSSSRTPSIPSRRPC